MAKDTIEDQTSKVFAKKEIEPDLLDRVTDFFSRERGLERSEKLENAISYYLGPYAGSLGQANQLLNPIVGLQDAGEATREGRYVDAVTDTAAAALPIAGALAAKPLARGVQSGIDEAVDAVTETTTDEDGNEVVTVITEAVEAVEAKDAYTRTDTYDTEDEAPEGATSKTRMGIRYPELLSFVAAYNEQRFASIEARLTALEA